MNGASMAAPAGVLPDADGKVAVLGGGSWGTVLASIAAARHDEVAVWCRDEGQAASCQRERENRRYLPGFQVAGAVRFTASLEEAVSGSGIVLVAVPTAAVRIVVDAVRPLVSSDAAVISASKGIEPVTHLRMSEVLEERLGADRPGGIAAISGPNLAREMAQGKPTGAVVASSRGTTALRVQRALSTPGFRLYTSTDLAGVELGGALKNIIAIGAGIVRGLDLGDNTLGALLTRGLAEMTRLGVHFGARPLTFNGLSGVGDLVATCASPLSRNHRVGQGISRGRPLDEVLRELGAVAEGVPTTRSVRELACEQEIEMPITREIYSVLFEGKSPREAVFDLMTRDLKSEEEFS